MTRGRRAALGLFAPWALLALGLWGMGLWILLQPMQLREMAATAMRIGHLG